MRNTIKEVLDNLEDIEIIDIIPDKIKKERNLYDIKEAIYNIHFPKTDEEKIKARETLCYEELLKVQTALLYIKGETKREKGIAFDKNVELNVILDSLLFKLTGAQLRTLEELELDLEKNLITERLIQGDVGSRKNYNNNTCSVQGSKIRISGSSNGTNCNTCRSAFRKL
jgi:ATP-dependent DNA helicase recG